MLRERSKTKTQNTNKTTKQILIQTRETKQILIQTRETEKNSRNVYYSERGYIYNMYEM